MIDVAVYNREGKELESLQVDEGVFGGVVRYPLLKQAIVMYHANKRVGTAATKSRGMVKGSVPGPSGGYVEIRSSQKA
jgi:large subunit ribosomal protein L4